MTTTSASSITTSTFTVTQCSAPTLHQKMMMAAKKKIQQQQQGEEESNSNRSNNTNNTNTNNTSTSTIINSETSFLAMSRHAVKFEQAQQRKMFLVRSKANGRLLDDCSVAEQYIATRMLIDETFRFYSKLRSAENKEHTATASKTATPPATCLIVAASKSDEHDQAVPLIGGPRANTSRRSFNISVLKQLSYDVGAIMGAESWGPASAKHTVHTTQKHPYLFTMNEIRKMGLFSEWQYYL